MNAARERIVITGAGVISALGAGAESFERRLYDGASGIGGGGLAEIADFDPQQWLGTKGVRVLDRSARLLCVAARMALGERGLVEGDHGEGDPELGMICGTMFGPLHSIVSFDWSGLTDGPSYVNPMEFANTVINSPAGQAAIRFKLRGINATVCAGLASGLYAMQYAVQALRSGRVRVLLAGGVEELCEESVLGFRKTGVSAPSGSIRPFRRDSDGTVLGEGSALMMVESAESAGTRGATPWAEISGFGCAHDAASISAYHVPADGAVAAIEQALDSAGIGPEQIGCVIASASGSRAGDAMEARALTSVFGDRLSRIPVSAPKAAFGEAMGASGALCALAGAMALRTAIAPPTAGFERTDDALRMSATPEPFDGDFVLVNAFSCDGNSAALVLGRWRA